MFNKMVDSIPEMSLKPCQEFVQRRHKCDPTHRFRSDFMRDRDRIMFSKAYRRLSGKTQVFTANFDDHARNRLTHTLEVALFARTLAGLLNLDIDLAEAIAMGHDVGHTPFGHSGELAINQIMNGCNSRILFNMYNQRGPFLKGFKHNLQSVRVLVDLERSFRLPRGLNLTNFTLYGIKEHTKSSWKECYKIVSDNTPKPDQDKGCIYDIKKGACPFDYCTKTDFYNIYNPYLVFQEPADKTVFNTESRSLLNRIYGKFSWSFEALIVELCDEIAQRHHDLEDGLETGIMTNYQVYHFLNDAFSDFIYSDVDRNNLKKLEMAINSVNFKSYLSRFIFNLYINKAYENISKKIEEFKKYHSIQNRTDWLHTYVDVTEAYSFDELLRIIKPIVNYDSGFEKADHALHKNLKTKILNSYEVQRMDSHGQYIIRKLFWAYLNNPQQLPDKTIYTLFTTFYYEQDFLLSRHKIEANNATNPMRIYNNLASKYDRFYTEGEYEHDMITLVANEFRNQIQFKKNDDEFRPSLLRVVCDYISGMTDNYALKEFKRLYH